MNAINDSRFATHDSRPATHDAPRTTHDSRPATHDAPRTAHDSRFATHDSRPATPSPRTTHYAPRTTPDSRLVNALSFDIEDWFHIVEVKAVEDPAQWPALSAQSSLVERYTDHILSLCDEAKAKGTFFMLGWIAERHPALVQRIHDAGHELATHSFWHRKVYELTPEVFSEDIAQSLAAIRAGAAGSRGDPSRIEIRGFRAPSFSITPGTEWAFDVLMDHGITYDASLFPGSRGHGGYACTPGAHLLTTPKGRTLPELPMSVAPVGVGPVKKRMCYSGGGYLRLLPLSLIEQGIQAERAHDRPTVVYLHPRDFAPDCPKVKMPPHRYFKCYVGTAGTTAKLRAMLKNHHWDTCARVLEAELARKKTA